MESNVGEKQPEPSYVLVTFKEIGSALFEVKPVNITAYQLLLAGIAIEDSARKHLSLAEEKELRQREMNKIQIAKPSDL